MPVFSTPNYNRLLIQHTTNCSIFPAVTYLPNEVYFTDLTQFQLLTKTK